MTYIINTNGITLFLNGKNVRLEKTDARYPKILKAISLPLDEQNEAVNLILNPLETKLDIINNTEGFVIDGENVTYNGESLPSALVQKVKSIVRDGLPLDHFAKFWENLQENPSATSIKELMDFLEYKELPITEDGHFLAYKGLNDDYYSIHGNSKTKVLKGKVDDAGRIYNGIGEEIEVGRNQVNDDRDVHCGTGLHCGSLNYSKSFVGSSGRLVVVKVHPKDVVSVPSDCDCQKLRCSAYTVIADYVEEISAAVVDDKGDSRYVTNESKIRKDVIDKVRNYLDKKEDAGFTELTVRQIQNIFSPEYPSKESILDALQELGYSWKTVDNTIIVSL